MKVSILQENLNKGLSAISKIISSKQTLPILSNVLLKTEEGKLKLTATNLEIGINIWLPAKKEKDGKFTVPVKDLAEFINSLPPGKIDLEEKQEKLQLKAGSYKAVFNGVLATEFPQVPSLLDEEMKSQVEKKFVLETEDFIKAVNQVCFAAAIDETRPVLTGVRISFLDDFWQLVATDGYRLSIKKIKLKNKINLPVMIIPAQALMEVVRLISIDGNKADGQLKIAITKENHQIIFSFGQIEVITRLIEGSFPEFEKIIPAQGESKVVFDRDELIQAAKATAIFARKSSNIIKFRFQKNIVSLEANAPEVGENTIDLAIKYLGEETQIAFNYRFLLEFLANFPEETFIFEFSGSLKPGMFKSERDPSFLHIIMPVRIQ